MKRLVLVTLFITALVPCVKAQDTLPKFSVRNVGNDRIIIGWNNRFQNLTQISIQRSFDSLTGFKTILTVTDPLSPQNGYVDASPTNDHMYYRLYMMQDNGHFMFSEAKKPILDTVAVSTSINTNPPDPIAPVTVQKNLPPGFVPSQYVFTNSDGYVNINLPEDEKPKKYSIKFFDEDGSLVFEIKDIKERNFKIDRTNFYHAGWFKFELYEDGKLMEKHKFLLEKEF